MRSVLLVLVAAVGFIDAMPMYRPSVSSRKVVSGADAERYEFPWILSLERQGTTGAWTHSCGGSLLAPFRSLTGAGCVEAANVNTLQMVAGLHMRSDKTGTVTAGCARTVIHAQYNSADASFANDIAIFYTTDPINQITNGPIQYATLPPNDIQNFAGDGCVMAGWGRTSSSNALPDTLQKAAIPVINVPACRLAFAPVAATVWDKQLCASDPDNNVGACTGDNGGPINCIPNVGQRSVVAGIFSWALSGPLGNCQQNFPSVFTRVSSYLSWINDN